MSEAEAPRDEMEGEGQEGRAETPPAPAPASPPQAPPAPRATVKRTPQFRQDLLKKLPQLAYTSWTVKDDFRIDEEWDAVVNLRADAILGPLETIAPERTS
jgi:hypothetical protein